MFVSDYAVIIARNLFGLHVSSKVIKTTHKDVHLNQEFRIHAITLNKVYMHIYSACTYCLKPMNIVRCK